MVDFAKSARTVKKRYVMTSSVHLDRDRSDESGVNPLTNFISLYKIHAQNLLLEPPLLNVETDLDLCCGSDVRLSWMKVTK